MRKLLALLLVCASAHSQTYPFTPPALQGSYYYNRLPQNDLILGTPATTVDQGTVYWNGTTWQSTPVYLPGGASNATTVNGATIPPSSTVVGTNSLGQFVQDTTTGSGSVVLSGSPALTNPNLGTPSAINLANATGPLASTVSTGGALTLNLTPSDCSSDVSITSFNAQVAAATAAGQGIFFPDDTCYLINTPIIAPTGSTYLFSHPGKSMLKADVNSQGGSLLFSVKGIANATIANGTNVTGFLVEGITLDGGLGLPGVPPGVAPGNPGTGTDATLSSFQGSINGTSLAISQVYTGSVYNGATIFDTSGQLATLGRTSLLTISNLTSNPCTTSCNGNVSAVPFVGNVGSEVMYTTNHTAMLAASEVMGFGSNSSTPYFGCNGLIFRNLTIQNFARNMGNIAGCNESGFENVKFTNVAAGNNAYQMTADLPMLSWNAGSIQFSASGPGSNTTTTLAVPASVSACGIYFLLQQDQASLNSQLYPIIADLTNPTYILNGTVVQSISGSCSSSGGAISTANLTLTLSQATTTVIPTTDNLKVYDNWATHNRVASSRCEFSGSCTIDIIGQQDFHCQDNRFIGSYATGLVTNSGGGNSTCYQQGSNLPGDLHTIITGNSIEGVTGNGLDINGGLGTVIANNIIINSGRVGLSLTSNGTPTSENPLVTMQDVSVTGNVVKNSHYSGNLLYQTGTATANGTQTGTTGSPITTLNLSGATGTCATGNYITSAGFGGYPTNPVTANMSGLANSSTWGSTVTMSLGLAGTITNGAQVYCNTRDPQPPSLGADLVFGNAPSSAYGVIENVSVGANVLGDDQFATLYTATQTTSGASQGATTLPFASTTGIVVGYQVYCQGLIPSSVVTVVTTNTSITLDRPVAQTIPASTPCYFYKPLPTTLYGIDVSSANLSLINVNLSPELTIYGSIGGNLSAAAQAALAYKVASLPACNAATSPNLRPIVTDATSPSYNGTLTGGGSVSVPAFCNGTNWVAH